MIEHEDYAVPMESREFAPLTLAHYLRESDPDTWGGDGIGRLRDMCAAWIAMRRAVGERTGADDHD